MVQLLQVSNAAGKVYLTCQAVIVVPPQQRFYGRNLHHQGLMKTLTGLPILVPKHPRQGKREQLVVLRWRGHILLPNVPCPHCVTLKYPFAKSYGISHHTMDMAFLKNILHTLGSQEKRDYRSN